MKHNSAVVKAFFKAFGIPAPQEEFRFSTERKFRFDYAWSLQKVCLEIEGGVWTGGRHTSGAGFMRDITKYNLATVMGWRVLRCTPEDLLKTKTALMVKEALGIE